MDHFEVCVIGGGLWGSATAKYLVKNGKRTCLIGPDKTRKEDVEKREVYESWNDISRICHVLFPDPVWAYLANESIKRYRELEEEAGVQFFHETGYLIISGSSEYLQSTMDGSKNMQSLIKIEKFTNRGQLENRFQMLRFPVDSKMAGIYEHGAGILNPIMFVEAQRSLFVKYGGMLINDLVIDVQQPHAQDGPFTIRTQSNRLIQSDSVIICAGAFLRHHKLLPADFQLGINIRPSLVVRIRIDKSPILESLMNTPPLIYVPDNAGSSIYTAPPILYPDGHYYMKIGYLDESSPFENRFLDTPDSITAVYRSNSEDDAEAKNKANIRLTSIFKSLFRGLVPEMSEVDTCAWTTSPNGRPHIVQVSPNWYVATGDNGLAAKSSDEIGRLIADMVINGKSSCQFPVQLDDGGKFWSV